MNKDDLEINVMMFGGRRCGKTSVLAAMQSCFENQFGKGNFMISTADTETLFAIEEKKEEILTYFQNKEKKRSFVPDQNPTENIMYYKFYISLKHKQNGRIVINFIDYPGEWISNPSKIKELETLMKESHIILVAIDTPHLMEETHNSDPNVLGEFNNKRNYCGIISDMLKNNFSLGSGEPKKMILFIPLKCEKYYNKNQMDQVSHKVKKAYETTFNYLDGPNKKYCEVAITPIFTLGCVEFHCFLRDDEGEIVLDPNWRTPKEASYIFTEPNAAQPSPKYCEQPLIYILCYIFERAREAKSAKKSSLFKNIACFIGETFLKMPSAKDFINESKNIKKVLKKTGDGYTIINNPFDF